jgi:hypothetical protein
LGHKVGWEMDMRVGEVIKHVLFCLVESVDHVVNDGTLFKNVFMLSSSAEDSTLHPKTGTHCWVSKIRASLEASILLAGRVHRLVSKRWRRQPRRKPYFNIPNGDSSLALPGYVNHHEW